jgi:hypothetical protein
VDEGLPPSEIHPDRILLRGRPGQPTYVASPKYESSVRLGPMRWGMTVRRADGERVVHELSRVRLGGA